ncbi:hypothetical protein MMC25_002449 [Agyrium rufum]|nr:hypothetical protein [Agyrium rufum]
MIVRCIFLLTAFSSWTWAAQKSAPTPVAAPIRPLPWGQLNFLHTTDTHGWHAGHLREASYSADWGDYISFAKHLRKRADDEGTDVLLVDTGDRVDGNGLYDASDPQGKYTRQIFEEQDVDILCSGNHELYKQVTSEQDFAEMVPAFKGNYLASNIDIIHPKSGDRVSLAPRYRKFTTKNQKIRVLAFGFLFDFTGNANNTFVQPVEQTIEEKWFQEAIRDRELDLIVVAGHVGLDQLEFSKIFEAIRLVRWDIPIQFFGGHAHVRAYHKMDAKSYALASGRYMETIGFLSISGLSTSDKNKHFEKKIEAEAIASPSFSRRYIDNNLYSLYQHTGLNGSTFRTSHGRNVSNIIAQARKHLELDEKFGCVPSTLWTNRAPFPAKNSLFSWLQDSVLPEKVNDTGLGDRPRIIIANTGAIRFDIFKGAFTKDTVFIVSPFTTGFKYISNVPFEKADKILEVLNNAGQILSRPGPGSLFNSAPSEQMASSFNSFESAYTQDAGFMSMEGSAVQRPLSATDDDSDGIPLVPGYTTKDDAGTDGDDTIHSPIQFYKVPNCIEMRIGAPSSANSKDKAPETVDLVFLEFIQPWVSRALWFLGVENTEADVKDYMGGKDFTSMIREWVQENWAGNC